MKQNFALQNTLHGYKVCEALLYSQNQNKFMYSVYILYSLKDDKLYIGFSSRLVRRIDDHLKGFSKSTKYRRPLMLLFCEYYLSKKDAIRREKYFKTADGKRTLRLMLKESLKEVKYKE